jgi:hypothetical protein
MPFRPCAVSDAVDCAVASCTRCFALDQQIPALDLLIALRVGSAVEKLRAARAGT